MAVSETLQPPQPGVGEHNAPATASQTPQNKLHGRDFYKSLGSPRYIIAPMVDRSEFV